MCKILVGRYLMSPLPDIKSCVRRLSFQVCMESLMNVLVLWNTMPCSLVPLIVDMPSYSRSLDCYKETLLNCLILLMESPECGDKSLRVLFSDLQL